tara:strand:- start:466 stop:684 length:219 start_codon:yes stop_codon:yes gene_type:complete
MFARQRIADLIEAAQMIAEEMALNLMDGIKEQWTWAGTLADIMAELTSFYADGATIDRDFTDYCEWLIENCI